MLTAKITILFSRVPQYGKMTIDFFLKNSMFEFYKTFCAIFSTRTMFLKMGVPYNHVKPGQSLESTKNMIEKKTQNPVKYRCQSRRIGCVALPSSDADHTTFGAFPVVFNYLK